MNVERLKVLADTIESGIAEIPDVGLVGFNMSVEWLKITPSTSAYIIPSRSDMPEPSKLAACGCFIGFTIVLFSPLKKELVESEYCYPFDLFTEAKILLNLDDEPARLLFFERMSAYVTGQDGARVIRKFLMTETIDWNMTR